MSFPGGGENVGDAYIRIHADSSGVPGEIRRGFKEHEGELEDQGKQDSKDYNESFRDQQQREDRVNRKQLEDSLRKNREAHRRAYKRDEDDLRTSQQQQTRDRAHSLKLSLDQVEQRFRFEGTEEQKNDEYLRKIRDRQLIDQRTLGKASDQIIAKQYQDQRDEEAKTDDYLRKLRERSVIQQDELLRMGDRQRAIDADRQRQREVEADDFVRKLMERQVIEQNALRRMADRLRVQDAERERSEARKTDDFLRNLRERQADEQNRLLRLGDQQRFIEAHRVRVEEERLGRERHDREEGLGRDYARQERLIRRINTASGTLFAHQNYYNGRYARAERDRYGAELRAARQRYIETGDSRELNQIYVQRSRLLNDYDRKLVRGNGRLRGGRRETEKIERDLAKWSGHVDKFSDRLGRAFGKGGRNNFTNALGSLVGGLARLGLGGGLRNVQRIARGFGNVKAAIRDGDTTLQKFKNVGDVFFHSFTSGLVKLVSLVGKGFAALNLVALIAGPLASAVSLLGGGISALVGSISIGLVGGIAELLPLIPVLAAGIGVAVLAFKGLSDAQKAALKVKLAPLRKEINGLQAAARKGIFSDLPHQVKLFGGVLNSLKPLVRGTGKALAEVATGFAKGLRSADFKKDLSVFNKFIPDSIKRIGDIAKNVFVGLTGLFRVLAPYTTRFLKGLQESAKSFREFTHSADGKNRIKTFMDGAIKSLDKLKLTAKLSYRVLRDLFGAGKKTGDTFLDSINSSLDRFDKYITGRGAGATRRYFEDVRKFFGSLGKAIGGLGRLFGALDSGQSRQSIDNILDFIGAAAKLVSTALPLIFTFQRVFFHTLGLISDDLVALIKPLGPLVKDISQIFSGGILIAAKSLATVLHFILVPLIALSNFIGEHADIFKPIIVSLLAFKAIAIGADIFGAITARIVSGGITLQNAIRGQATAISRRASGLNAALAGIGLGATVGYLAGSKIGGTGGKVVGALGGAATGALAGGAIGGLPGAAIGGLIGGVTGLVTAWNSEGDASDAAKQKAVAAAQAQKQAVDSLLNSLQSTNGAYNDQIKLVAASDFRQRGGFQAARAAGLSTPTDLSNINKATLGDQDAINALLAKTQSVQRKAAVIQARIFSRPDLPDPSRADLKILKQAKAYHELYKILGLTSGTVGTAEQDFEDFQASLGKTRVPTKLLAEGTKNLAKELRGSGHATIFDSDAQIAHSGYARKNTAIIRDNIAATGISAAVQLRHGASVASVSGKYQSQIGTLRQTLSQLGFNASEVERLISKYARVPKKVQTYIEAHSEQAKQAVQDFQNILNGLHDKSVHVYADTNSAAAALQRFVNTPSYKYVQVVTRGADGTPSGGQAQLLPRARGGILNRPTAVLAGEAGPEAYVPLRRPLSQVDPSVRALSAFAQGLPDPQRFASGGVRGTGDRTITFQDGAVRVLTPTTDPLAVASELFNKLVAGGYS